MKTLIKFIISMSTVLMVISLFYISKMIKEDTRQREEILIQSRIEEENKIPKLKYIDEQEVFPDKDRLLSSEDVLSGAATGKIMINSSKFIEESISDTWGSNTFVRCKTPRSSEKDILILEFVVSTQNTTEIDLKVVLGDTVNNFSVNNVKTKYYLPFTGIDGEEELRFSYEITSDVVSPVILSDVCLVNYRKNYPLSYLKTGAYTQKDYEYVTVNAEDSSIRGEAALPVSDLLYVISRGELIIYRNNQNQMEEINRVGGLGETRDIQISPDQKTIVVTSRGSGAYILDVTNPEEPVLASHYDTLELCVGVDIYQNYAFIASRQFGVEVVDIADPYHPKHITRIQAASGLYEYQDCYVENGYLYIGVYENKCVDIYDVRNLTDVKFMSSIELDGAGQGLTVKDGILFISTSRNDRSHAFENSFDLGFGFGSGLEIYDVHRPDTPILLAREKIDGRNSVYPHDVWDVSVNDNKAYVSLMNGGCYIYDISEPSAPDLLKRIDIVATRDSWRYRELNMEKEVIPFPAYEEYHGCITHTFGSKNQLYIVAPDMGIYTLPEKWNDKEKREEKTKLVYNEERKPIGISDNYTYTQWKCDSSVYAVKEAYDGNLIVACGDGGIRVLDKEMNEIGAYQTDFSVKDIRLRDNHLYAAESDGGFSTYQYENGVITKLGNCNDTEFNSYYSSLEVTTDGRLAVVQTGYSQYQLVDCSDLYNPYLVEIPTQDPVGATYYRNICVGCVDDKYIGISGKKGINWFYYDDGIKYLSDTSDNILLEHSGLAAYKDKYIFITLYGYKYVDLLSGEISEKHDFDSEYFRGKCAIYNDILLVSREYEGKISAIDISDIDNPKKMCQFDVDCITDIPLICGDSIYIPCRFDGLLKVLIQN